jgi:hypothetical protein
MCALVLIFYTYKVKNLFCVAKIVTSIVLECCEPYSGTENFGEHLINKRLETVFNCCTLPFFLTFFLHLTAPERAIYVKMMLAFVGFTTKIHL